MITGYVKNILLTINQLILFRTYQSRYDTYIKENDNVIRNLLRLRVDKRIKIYITNIRD